MTYPFYSHITQVLSSRKHVSTVYEDLLRSNQSSMLVNNHAISLLRSKNVPANIETAYSTILEEYKSV